MARDTVSLEYMEVCREHPEAEEIFKLAQLLTDAGYDFWFNVQDDYSQYTSADVFGEDYEYIIETQTGELISGCRAPITVFWNRYGEGGEGLELLDMRPAREMFYPEEDAGELHTGLSAQQAMEIIEELYKTAK